MSKERGCPGLMSREDTLPDFFMEDSILSYDLSHDAFPVTYPPPQQTPVKTLSILVSETLYVSVEYDVENAA